MLRTCRCHIRIGSRHEPMTQQWFRIINLLHVEQDLNGLVQPFKSLIKTLTSSSYTGLEMHQPPLDGPQSQLVIHLIQRYGIRQVPLVCKHLHSQTWKIQLESSSWSLQVENYQNGSVKHVIFVEDFWEFFSCFRNSFSIVAVNHKYQSVRSLKVMSPQLFKLKFKLKVELKVELKVPVGFYPDHP